MAIARSVEQVMSCGVSAPMVIQRYVNHGGVLWKVIFAAAAAAAADAF